MSGERQRLLNYFDIMHDLLVTHQGWRRKNKKAEQIRQLIQQQPEIDDMKEYVAKKEMELFDAIIAIQSIDGTVNKFFSNSGKIGIEKRKKFITQIIKDTRGLK